MKPGLVGGRGGPASPSHVTKALARLLRAGKKCPEIAVFDLDPDATYRGSRTERVALRD